MAYDLLIKGGTVVDPSQGLKAIRDVALADGSVAAVEEGIAEADASEVVDANGLIVTPGLLDLHVHAYWGVCVYGIEPDSVNVAKGVTTALDAGSAGARTFPAFRRYVLERSDTRLFALLNISAMGMISHEIGELQDMRWADVGEAARAGRENRDYVRGIKVRLSRQQALENDVEMLKRALEAAGAFDGFVMAHVGDTATPLEELTAMLRPGDVVTHSFHGRPVSILNDAGRVIEGVKEAQRRGVIFDVGHGMGSFSFDTAEKSLADGFYPDNISSDLSSLSVEGPVFDLVTVLSKFIYLGMSLYDVIRLSTLTTARAMGVADKLGTLRVGADGDVAILKLEVGEFTLTDAVGVSVQGSQRLSHIRTIRSGRIYRPALK